MRKIFNKYSLVGLLSLAIIQSLYHLIFTELDSSATNAQVAILAVFIIITGLVLSLIKHKTI
jgi:hypothetical protein